MQGFDLRVLLSLESNGQWVKRKLYLVRSPFCRLLGSKSNRSLLNLVAELHFILAGGVFGCRGALVAGICRRPCGPPFLRGRGALRVCDRALAVFYFQSLSLFFFFFFFLLKARTTITSLYKSQLLYIELCCILVHSIDMLLFLASQVCGFYYVLQLLLTVQPILCLYALCGFPFR